MIYVLFRNTDQIIAFKYLGINYGKLINIESSFIKFHLIDLLFYLGFMSIVKAVFIKKNKLFILSFWFLLLELSQIYFDIGTFDPIDVLMILLSLFIILNQSKIIKIRPDKG